MTAHPLRLYAHRGASAEAPENTLPAFQRALEVGADAIELDVHMTRDGVPVVAHDASAQRMTGMAAAWRELDLADVQQLDAGQGFTAADGSRPFAGRGLRVPTFDEVLAALPGVVINVDIKQPRPSMVEAMRATIRRHRAEERVILASFHLRTLFAVRRGQRGGATALSKPEVAAVLYAPRAVLACLPYLGNCAQVPVRAGSHVLAAPAFIAKCHALGMRVDFWTVNDPAQAEQLLALGADGVMTDDPRAIAPVFAAWRRRPGGGR